MTSRKLASALRVIEVTQDSGKIHPEETIKKLGAGIEEGQLIVLRGAWSARELLELRRDILAWAFSDQTV